MSQNFSTETVFTPDWHHKFSRFLGDLKGEIGYVTEFGTVHLIGKRHVDISKDETESRTDGPTKCITACKPGSIL